MKTKLAIFTTVILWASAFVGIRAGLQSYGPGELALLRFLVGSIGMLILYLRLPQRHIPTKKEILPLLMISVLGIGVYNIALNYGELTVTAGIASFIIGLIPVLSILLATTFLRERFRHRAWLGVIVSFLGLFVIAHSKGATIYAIHGVWYIVLAAFMSAIFTVWQKPFLEKFHPIEIASFAIWGGTLLLLFYTPGLIKQFPQATWQATTWAVYMGIFPAAIAYAAWSYALAHAPASKVVVYLYAMPFIATLMGWLLLGEIPLVSSLVGGVITILGAFIVNRLR